jgi:hypothetical protein
MKKFKSIREELLFLSQKNEGLLSPQNIVEYAKNQNTLLHSKFEWNDEKAGYEYRLWQARKIISLEFEIIKSDDKDLKPVRLFISLKDDRNCETGYRLITNVLTNEEYRGRMLKEALEELNRIREKYQMLTELAKVFAVIKELVNVE